MKGKYDMKPMIALLAQAMAYKACEKKDIQTTAEGRSALKYHYANARIMVSEAVDEYLDKV